MLLLIKHDGKWKLHSEEHRVMEIFKHVLHIEYYSPVFNGWFFCACRKADVFPSKEDAELECKKRNKKK